MPVIRYRIPASAFFRATADGDMDFMDFDPTMARREDERRTQILGERRSARPSGDADGRSEHSGKRASRRRKLQS